MIKRQMMRLGLLLLSGIGLLPAQNIPQNFDFIDGNKVKARLMNGADHFWDLIGSPSYEVPAGSGKHSAFASSIWIGGVDASSQLHVAANTYRQSGNDFFSGAFRSSGNYNFSPGFNAPAAVFERGLTALSSGKVMATYPNGFIVYDPASQTTVTKFLPQTRNIYDVVELPNGQILLYGDDAASTITDAMLIDSTNFNPMPIGPLNFFHRYSSATILPNGKVLIAGVAGCEIFDPANNTSTAAAPMSQARLNHAVMLLASGKVMVAGGNSTLNATGATATTEIYDPATDSWTAGPMMNVARGAAQATPIAGGNWLITGGALNFSTFDVYDPAANTMTSVAGIGQAIDRHAAVPQLSGDVLISAEYTSLDPGVLGTYDPANQTFQPLNLVGVDYLATATTSGKIIVELWNDEFRTFDPLSNSLDGLEYDKIWKVRRSEIDQFLLDFQNNQVNFMNYPDIADWPAHGNTAAGEDPYLAPFVDVNMDGQYDPLNDGDYPCFEGDLGMWWVFNDDGPHTETNGNRMGVQIETMAYVYDCSTSNCPDTALDYTTFYHHEITNKSNQTYTDVYIGVWMDTDIGDFSDDYVGSDSVLGMGFGYNGDNVDGTSSGYGVAPPALGTMFMEQPGNIGMATNFMYYENDFSLRGNPEQPVHFYNYMRSVFKDGTHLVNNGSNGYSGTGPGPDIDMIYPGDPGFCGGPSNGWSEVSAGNQPFDRRYLQSVGPLTLVPGQKVELDIAMIWARGSDNLNSVCVLKSAASNIKAWWEGQPHGCFNIVLAEEEPELVAANIGVFPNPTTGDFTVELGQSLKKGGALTVYDLAGKLVHSQALAAQQARYRIRPGKLAEGMYFVKIDDGKATFTKRLVVQR